MIFNLIGLYKTPLSMLALLIAYLSAMFICLPAHEFAHAHAAIKEGDLTPKLTKRYTLSPFAHIDPFGFLMLIFFGFGFAKPVQVNENNFKRGKLSRLRVSLAGILTNLAVGTIACLIYSCLFVFFPEFFVDGGFWGELYTKFFTYTISINFAFAFFNILPIYPLDGFRLVETFSKTENGFIRFMKRYSSIIFLVLLITPVFDYVVGFFAGGLANLLLDLFTKFFAIF